VQLPAEHGGKPAAELAGIHYLLRPLTVDRIGSGEPAQDLLRFDLAEAGAVGETSGLHPVVRTE
jgi:hypothetical protein